MEARPELKGPGCLGELAKVLAAEWKDMIPEEKRTYDEEAAKLRETYKEEKRAYCERHPEFVPQKRGSAPKRAASRGGTRNHKRRRRQSGRSREDEAEDDLEDEDDEESAASMEAEEEGTKEVRRSQRLRETPAQGLAPGATLVLHPPTPNRRNRKRSAEDGEDRAADESGSHMSFRQYLEYDRQQDKLRAAARLERQKRKLVNGESSDEELQMALAISLSESQAESQAPVTSRSEESLVETGSSARSKVDGESQESSAHPDRFVPNEGEGDDKPAEEYQGQGASE